MAMWPLMVLLCDGNDAGEVIAEIFAELMASLLPLLLMVTMMVMMELIMTMMMLIAGTGETHEFQSAFVAPVVLCCHVAVAVVALQRE